MYIGRGVLCLPCNFEYLGWPSGLIIIITIIIISSIKTIEPVFSLFLLLHYLTVTQLCVKTHMHC